MSFFKSIGKLAGNFLGLRSGASSQARQFNSDWGQQIQAQAGELQAQRFAFDSAIQTQNLYDRTQQTVDDLNRQDAQNDSTKVKLGQASGRNYFTFGA